MSFLCARADAYGVQDFPMSATCTLNVSQASFGWV